ncbi:MAG: cysteine--tRNA ligase [Patescibacteria group bacterium]
MKFYNTLTNRLEEFAPLHNRLATLYSCGPTVYDVAHIGNLRTYLFNDVLKRTLLANDFRVKHVMNVTDVDDKTIKKSGGDKTRLRELTRRYEKIFFEDLSALNILLPDLVTRATAYVERMADFVAELLRRGFAYRGEDGSVYFSIDKFKDYGKLAKLDRAGIRAGARVSQDEYTKENPADFVLWKAWDKDDGDIYWETKIGRGRPGWHIECSVMAGETLGQTIDIHTGAVDLIFPHHENEIAQSEALSSKDFVRFWVHGEHLLVDSQKMAKSLGNVYNLKDLTERGFSPLDFRYLVLGAHYRTKLNFTWAGLEAAKNARERLNRLMPEITSEVNVPKHLRGGGAEVNQDYLNKFYDRISDDLDTPGGLATLWEMARDESVSAEIRTATAQKMDEVLGLKLGEKEELAIPPEIKKLAAKREEARRQKDYALSDKIRQELEGKGWRIEDKKTGYLLTKI